MNGGKYTFLITAILLLGARAAEACAGCVDTNAAAGDISPLGYAVSISILFMLIVPMLLMAGLGVMIFIACKKISAVQEAEPASGQVG